MTTIASGTQFQLFPELRPDEYEALKADIAERGILVPAEVDQDGQVLDGHHRLRIAGELGIDCPTVQRTFASDDERRAHIIAINVVRRQLDGVARGRWLRELAKLRGVRLGTQGRQRAKSPNLGDIAKEVGVKKSQAQRDVAAADTVDAYPFMEGWKEYRVLEAREHMEALPDDTKETMVEMLSEPGVPPKTAISMLGNVRQMPKAEQKKIAKLYASGDDRDRSLAKTKAVELPPSPDRRLVELMQIERGLRACIKWYPDDPLVETFETLIKAVQKTQEAINEQQEARQDGS